MILNIQNGEALIEEPLPGSALFQEMRTFDFYADKPVVLKTIYIKKTDRLMKEIFYLPSLLILILIYFNQYTRRKKLKKES